MKRLLNVLVAFALVVSATSVFAQETKPVKPVVPEVPLVLPELPDLLPNPTPTPTKPATPPAPPLDLRSLDELLDGFLAVPHAGPTAAELETEYNLHWKRLYDLYVFREKLPVLTEQKDKYKGKLATVEELNKALKTLYSSLNDKWTNFQSWDEIHGAGGGMFFFGPMKFEMGIGLKKEKDGSRRIEFIDWGSPAHKSALREGYVVTAVGKKKLAGLTDAQVNELLEGEGGTEVKVTYQLPDGSTRKTKVTFNATDKDVVVVSVKDSVVYIRLPDFVGAKHIPTIKSKLRKEWDAAGGKLTGIVLDLRNNGGGHPEKATEMARLFVADGSIMRFRKRDGRMTTTTEYVIEREVEVDRAAIGADAKYNDFLQKSPMTVLVNGSTASSSEILLAALQDAGRVKVVGTKTYGKGVAYRYFETEAGMVQLTVAHYVRPNGKALHGEGITPDVETRQPANGKDRQLDVATKMVKRAAK